LILDEVGKHFPITFIVSMDSKATVDQVAIMTYREKRGDAVKRKRFLNQFKNKGVNDSMEVNNDIISLTGATISSWSVASGVKKAVVLTEELMLKNEKK
jgi:electron transport complex protein RnfG